MAFDKDAELDPRLTSVGAAALLAHYEEQYEGFQLCKLMKAQAPADEEKKLAPRIDKAIKAALADLEVLVTLVDAPSEEDAKPEGVDNETTLREMYWRIHDGWPNASGEARAEAAANLKMVLVTGGTPSWQDFAMMLGEIAAMDHDGGDGESFPAEWYDDLLERFETKLGKKKPKKKTGARAAAVLRTPPPGATIHEYSPKSTYREDDWVSHPKFGTGIVVESGPNVLIEFGPEQKRLAHVPIAISPAAPVKVKTKTSPDTLELARQQGVEIKKIPARIEDETKK